MSNDALIEFFVKNGEIFARNSLGMGVIRDIGFFFFKVIVKLADACQSLYDLTFGLVDFTAWPKVNNFIDSFKPLFVVLMAISLFALGVMLIFNHEKKPKIMINLCIAVLCVTCSTVVFQELNTVVKDVKEGIDASAKKSAAADVYDIVENNMIDLYYADQKVGLSKLNYRDQPDKIPHPDITKDRLAVMDYSQVLDTGNDAFSFSDSNAEDILSQGIMSNGEGGYQVYEIYNGVAWTSVGNNFYFRYHMDTLPAVLELIAVILLYIAMAYKCTRIAFELVFARLLAYLYSAELSGGQKIARILTFIRDTYILLLVTTLCIKIFYFFNAYVTAEVDSALLQAIIILFVAFCVIDGPNLVEKLLGMDAGLKSSTARLIAGYRMARGGVHMATSPVRAAGRWGMHRYMNTRGQKETAAAENENAAFMAGATGVNAESAAAMDNMHEPGTERGQTRTGRESPQTGAAMGYAEAGEGQDADHMGPANADGPEAAKDKQTDFDTSFMAGKPETDGREAGRAQYMDARTAEREQGAAAVDNMAERERTGTKAAKDPTANAEFMRREETSGKTAQKDPQSRMQERARAEQERHGTKPKNRVISNYKGHIFDRNMNGGGSMDKKDPGKDLNKDLKKEMNRKEKKEGMRDEVSGNRRNRKPE